MTLSVVIPTFQRCALLDKCLSSVLSQTYSPSEVFVIDNEGSDKTRRLIESRKQEFRSLKVGLIYIKNTVNSGAIARNIGIKSSSGEFVALIDDDTILNENFFELIIELFNGDDQVKGVQGFDLEFFVAQKKINEISLARAIYEFEKFFQISSFYGKKPVVLPSLCVVNPMPVHGPVVETNWLSTCACVYRCEVFEKNMFDEQMMKYSWNEYIDFSLRVSRQFPNSLRFLSTANYYDLQVPDGRMNNVELMYMAEAYDLYIFYKLFPLTIKNKVIYWWSKFGRLLFNILRAIKRREHINIVFHCFGAFIFPIRNFNDISKGDLSKFHERISVEEKSNKA